MTEIKIPIFQTEVTEIGQDAQSFKDINMLILFGNEAPDLLKESCFIINSKDLKDKITPGMTIQIGNDTYTITAVGKEVDTNLRNLGHIAIKFTGEDKAELPGSLYVEKKEFPTIAVGTKILIF
ncbi:PTS glucitol/sorbitol transporter subunit IIA [Lactobacillus sp. ESL0791]|uniref:PTS glucitol/sorbitol transporter subunit IIA n=1 Tax=Lactobacillus sp. ESL0791 TaxID=2983234 RepID=UPI0023F9D11C|nr:PTS glucitol/sorbitol transporter subunit IIA [Lactobacillus sp. ESL0791]MDF7638628.1 PTS glucitol/sorbitol transporter subunit IIA [Lactobacillus sp. ESL0791]